MKDFLLPLLLGAGTGILASWGIGGGTLLLLAMTLFLGVEQTTAQSINLLFFLPTAAVALLFHAKSGYLKSGVLKRCIPPGLIAALLASLLAAHIDVELLRKPFGIFLLLSAVSLWRGQKKEGQRPRH